jgi:uncharacterized protein involved in exopolysaccharide biosynthesis
MGEMFDALEFAGYARKRWMAIAIACGVALALTLNVSLLLPKRYTATASLIIQAPGGNDPRASTAVSPVYLDSLKSYESFASSDTLFVRALDALHVRDGHPGASIESLKKGVLKVTKPAGTAIVEVSATLGDARKAQAVAQYIAEQTVELSRSLDAQASNELATEFRTQVETARRRYTDARQAREVFAAAQPLEGLESEVQQARDLKFRVEQDLEAARSDDGGVNNKRIAAMEDRVRRLDKVLAEKGPELETRKIRRDALEREERSSMEGWEEAKEKMNEMLSSAKFHGERLRIVDPGIVPDQSSSPDTALNLAAALVLSLAGCLVWLALGFSHSRLTVARAERDYRVRAVR